RHFSLGRGFFMHSNSSLNARILARVFPAGLGALLGRPCRGDIQSFCTAIPAVSLFRPLLVRPRLWKLAVVVLLAFGLQLQAGARAATFITFDPPGSTFTLPLAINPAGAITGNYNDASNVTHGFVRSPDGEITTFDPSGSTSTFSAAINPAGA